MIHGGLFQGGDHDFFRPKNAATCRGVLPSLGKFGRAPISNRSLATSVRPERAELNGEYLHLAKH